MPKWEYCMLTGMGHYSPRHPMPRLLEDAAFVRITNKGFEHVEEAFKSLPKGVTLPDAVAQLIADLGDEGWEMVGGGSTHEGSLYTLYLSVRET